MSSAGGMEVMRVRWERPPAPGRAGVTAFAGRFDGDISVHAALTDAGGVVRQEYARLEAARADDPAARRAFREGVRKVEALLRAADAAVEWPPLVKDLLEGGQ